MKNVLREGVISVIIPVYNVEKYLHRCIESVVNQTYGKLEIILVDDGSSDSCGESCDAWKKRDNRISVIHQENQGLSAARNSGLRIASGEYVLFVDSDDYLAADLCNTLVSEMANPDIDCCACGFSEISEENLVLGSHFSASKVTFSGIEAVREVYLHNNCEINLVMAWGKLFRRSVWENLWFTQGIYYEDLDILPELCVRCRNIRFIPFVGYYYCQRIGSISRGTGRNDKRLIDSLIIRDKHIAYYLKIKEQKLASVSARKMFELIIIADSKGWIPESYRTTCASLMKKHWKIAIRNAQMREILRYMLYYLCGATISDAVLGKLRVFLYR